MNDFRIKVDTREISDKLRVTQDLIDNKVKNIVERVSIATHHFVINKAKTELTGYMQETFLGTGESAKNTSDKSSNHPNVDKTPRHVRWKKIDNGTWVVEIDEKAKWIEEGRPRTFMGEEWWLLQPGKAKVAKDGSTYRAIPMTKMKGSKPTFETGLLGEGPASVMSKAIRSAAKEQKISLTAIEKDKEGLPIAGPVNPKTGLKGPAILHKLQIKEPEGGRQEFPLFYSKERTAEESKATGLKPYSGSFHVKGAVVTQREVKPGKFKKETIVYRIISSKHRNDNRWYYPEVKPFHAIPAAHKYAQESIDLYIKELEEEIKAQWP